RRPDRSVHHVGGVEEDLLDRLALLTHQARDPEPAVADLAAALAAPLEVAAAAAPASPQMLVHLGIGANVERAVGRRAGACPRGAVQSRAVEPATPDGGHGGHHREPDEKAEHDAASSRYPRATATRVWTSIASVSRLPAAKAIVRCGCRPAM